MLKIAVPNKGALSEAAAEMLSEAGYAQRRDRRDLSLEDRDHGVHFFYLRPRDIAVYVGAGTLDVGITGRDLLRDSRTAATEVMPLGFGGSTFRFAAPPGVVKEVTDLAGLRIATSYAAVVEDFLAEHGITAHVVRLDGAVESSVGLGVADVIADVVETGATLRQAGLEIVTRPILVSEGVLITRRGAEHPPGFDVLRRRLESVIVARTYVMMDYDIRVEQLEEAITLTPGIESPTISPLHREGWVAVRAMVPRERAQLVMDSLWALGARGTLVTDILACRL